MNKVILIGRLVKDPEIRMTPNNVSVCQFTLAVDRRFKSQDGQNTADFINCVAWRNQADFLGKYFQKGSKVVLTGSIQSRSYTDKDNNRRYVTEVVAEDIEFGESKKNGSSTPVFDDLQEPQAMTGSAQGNVSRGEYYELDESGLPF